MTVTSRIDRRSLAVLLLAPLVVLALVLLGSGPATGQTAGDGEILVERTDDRAELGFCEGDLKKGLGHNCSLREAVLLANQDETIHTIVLTAAQEEQPYELTIPGANEDDGETGDLDVHDDLTIVGLGSGQTEIVAEWDSTEEDNGEVTPRLEGPAPDEDRLIHVHGEESSLTLEGLTLSGGEADGDGGAILLDGADLTTDDVRIDGNVASQDGGAIAARGPAAMTLTDTVIHDNEGRFGGGLFLIGVDAHLSGSEVSDNRARGNNGGGILAVPQEGQEEHSTVLLENGSVVGGNSSNWQGGGIYTTAAHVEATDTTFADNEAPTGAALHVVGGDVTLTRVAVAGNEGQSAGGVFLVGGLAEPEFEPAGDLTVVDSTFSDNHGIWEGAGALVLTTDAFAFGDSLDAGGDDAEAQYDYDYDLPAYEVTIEGSTFDGNSGGLGDQDAEAAAAVVAPGESYSAGAVWVMDGYEGTIANSTFSGNTTSGVGAGLRVDHLNAGDLELVHVTFADHALDEPVWAVEEDPEDVEPGAALHVEPVWAYRPTEVADEGEVRLSHTLLADSDDRNCGGDLERIISLGHNLDDDGTCEFDANGDVQADAALGALADNGGLTLTQLPAAGSPAIDGGADDCEIQVDQRGIARPQGEACDIGAVEVEQDPFVPDPERPFGCDPDAADRFSDVHPDGVHRDNIGCAADLGFVVGFVDGTYRPGIDMSRGQFATVVARMVEFILDEELPIGDGVTFPDVPAGHVHEDGILKLATAGLVVGFEDGDYRPGDSLRRGQAASILDAAITTATGEQLPDGPSAFLDHQGSPHEGALDRLAQEGIVTGYGDGTVRPSREIQRGQLASMVVRTLVAVEGLLIGEG